MRVAHAKFLASRFFWSRTNNQMLERSATGQQTPEKGLRAFQGHLFRVMVKCPERNQTWSSKTDSQGLVHERGLRPGDNFEDLPVQLFCLYLSNYFRLYLSVHLVIIFGQPSIFWEFLWKLLYCFIESSSPNLYHIQPDVMQDDDTND